MILTEIFKNRPFALLCAVFMSASLVCFLVIGTYKLIAAVAFAALGVIMLAVDIIRRRVKFSKAALVFVLPVILACLVSYSHFDLSYRNVRLLDGENRTVEGVVLEEKSCSEHGSVYTVRITSVDGNRVNVKARLECEYGGSFVIGDGFRMTVDLSEPKDSSPTYSTKLNAISDGIMLFAYSHDENSYEPQDAQSNDLEVLFGKLRASLSVRLSRAVGGEAGDLASAMVLSDRAGLNSGTVRDFSRSGVSHILALSGLHMGIISAIIDWLLRRMAAPKWIRCIVTAIFMVAYLALTGFSLSAVRAVMMLCAVYMSFIISTPADTRTVLFAAGTVIFLVAPYAVCDAGFWMSFLATLGILTVSPYVSRTFATERRDSDVKRVTFRFLRYLLSAVVITMVANLAVVVISWLCFGEISIVAPLANILLAPLSGVMIFLSFMTLITHFVYAPISDILAELTNFVGDMMLDIVAEISEMRGIVISLKYDFAAPIIVLFAVCTAIFLVVKLKHKWITLMPAAVAVTAFAVCLLCFNAVNDGKVNASYIHQKGGEMLVLSENGKTVICDISEGYLSRFIRAALKSEEHYATEVEVMILTHYHSRYPVTLSAFFSEVRLRELWVPRPELPEEVEYLEDIYRKARSAGVRISVYERGTELKLFGQATLTVSPYDKLARSVEALNCITVENRGSRMTYVGSSYSESDYCDASREYIRDSDAVIFGDHGPNPKRNFFFDVSPGCDSVIFADEEALDLFDVGRLPTSVKQILFPEETDFVLG